MATARIAGSLFAAFLSLVAAQQPPHSQSARLTIEAVDTSGAVIPAAQFVIDHDFFLIDSNTKTGPDGTGIVDLPFGTHTIRLWARGFKVHTEEMEISSSSPPQVTVTLQIANDGCTICVTPDPAAFIPLESAKTSESIPLQPLRNFGPLSLRRIKRRW